MRLISWNINVRKNCARHINALSGRNPDIVVLQEVNPNCLSELREKLPLIGLGNVVDNASLAAEFGRKHYYGLIASRWPINSLSPEIFDIPFPDSVLSATIASPKFNLEIHSAHIPPGSSQGWTKIETFEGIYKYLTEYTHSPRILCGDFNSPQLELPDGQILTWGQTRKGKIRKSRGARWDAGERGVIQHLKNYDLPDVFRLLHGYEIQEYSIEMNHKGKITRRRFDHVFASKMLNPSSCQYLHEWREQGMSDHSPLEVDFSPMDK